MALELSDIQTAYQHVLVGVDESEQGQVALASAVHQALEDQAKLTIATVLELGDLSTTDVLSLSAVNKRREDLEKNLQTYKAYAIAQGVTDIETVLADGAKAGEVLAMELAPEIKADLLIVGAHSKQGMWPSLGSQAVYIARHAKISSLIARR